MIQAPIIYKIKVFERLRILVLLLFSIPCISNAQQDSQYTQYMYNTVSFNPAYAGNRGVLSVLGLYRSQWVGIDGAPRTQVLSLNTPLKRNTKIGVAFSAINDNAGALNETNINTSFSYTIEFGRESKFSFGINAGGTLLNADILALRRIHPEDPLVQQNIENTFSPNVGLGLYQHSDQFYLGLSVPNLLKTKHYNRSALQDSDVEILAKESINYYLMAGYVFDVASLLKFKPATLIKYVSGSPLQVDLSANFLYNDKLTLGAAYRWSKAISVLAGFQVSEGIMIGFAYDKDITPLGKTEVSGGSYEVVLRFELKKTYSRYLTPRFF